MYALRVFRSSRNATTRSLPRQAWTRHLRIFLQRLEHSNPIFERLNPAAFLPSSTCQTFRDAGLTEPLKPVSRRFRLPSHPDLIRGPSRSNHVSTTRLAAVKDGGALVSAVADERDPPRIALGERGSARRPRVGAKAGGREFREVEALESLQVWRFEEVQEAVEDAVWHQALPDDVGAADHKAVYL